jgi:hypothetical protein
VKVLQRIVCILLWAILFFVTPAFLGGAIIATLYLPHDPDPPTEMAFGFAMCFSPVSGVIGLVLGLCRLLPGTK